MIKSSKRRALCCLLSFLLACCLVALCFISSVSMSFFDTERVIEMCSTDEIVLEACDKLFTVYTGFDEEYGIPRDVFISAVGEGDVRQAQSDMISSMHGGRIYVVANHTLEAKYLAAFTEHYEKNGEELTDERLETLNYIAQSTAREFSNAVLDDIIYILADIVPTLKSLATILFSFFTTFAFAVSMLLLYYFRMKTPVLSFISSSFISSGAFCLLALPVLKSLDLTAAASLSETYATVFNSGFDYFIKLTSWLVGALLVAGAVLFAVFAVYYTQNQSSLENEKRNYRLTRLTNVRKENDDESPFYIPNK